MRRLLYGILGAFWVFSAGCGVIKAGVTGGLQRQRIDASKIAMKSISGTLDVYRTEHDQYPGDLQTLVHDGFLKEKQIRDPWNEVFKYRPIRDDDGFKTDFQLASNGPDRLAGTIDDTQCEDHEFR